MKHRLESEHLTDVARGHVIFFEHLLEDNTNVLEDTLGDLDAILFFEELEHLLAIKLLGLGTCDEVSLTGNLAAVRENDGAGVIIEIVVLFHLR